MNLPNKLTVLRIFMIPLFLIFMEAYRFNLPNNFLWAFIIFIVACLTDTLDGYIARRDNIITNFGKLMDPLADKLLVMSALVSLTYIGNIPGWITVVILSREFLVTSIRLLAAGNGKVIAADKWGKMKTISQMVWLCAELLYQHFSQFNISNIFNYGCTALMGISVFFTVFSGYNYVKNNLEVFKD